MEKFRPLIQRVIGSNYKLVLSITGCGGKLLESMTAFPSSSKFFLQGTNSYSRESLKTYIKREVVEKYCSDEIIELQANQSFNRAQTLAFNQIGNNFAEIHKVNMKQIIGIGVNGAVSTSYQKKGPIQCFLAIRRYNTIRKYHIQIKEPKTRQIEEQIFSLTCLRLIVSFIYNEDDVEIINTNELIKVSRVDRKIEIYQHEYILLPSMFEKPPLDKVSIFAGSFNPFHIGHYEIFNISKKHNLVKDTALFLQITIKNAAKAEDTNVVPRILSILHMFKHKNHQYKLTEVNDFQDLMDQLREQDIQILLTRRGKFVEKGVRNGTYIMGADTYVRLTDIKYYTNQKQVNRTIAKFNADQVNFLIFNRKSTTKQFIEIKDFGLNYEIANGWHNDISSTALRSKNKISD